MTLPATPTLSNNPADDWLTAKLVEYWAPRVRALLKLRPDLRPLATWPAPPDVVDRLRLELADELRDGGEWGRCPDRDTMERVLLWMAWGLDDVKARA